MDRWNELQTAFWVARLGTVSAAAAKLGVHRATVVRHVDALEHELGGRLFQRHGRGYVLTEAGEDLLRVAGAADEQFRQLAGRTRGRSAEVTGEIVVTSVDVMAPVVLPSLQTFRAEHPETRVRFESSYRIYKLEYGEAHVAIRSGARPSHPDNVVRHFMTLRSGLYAHRDYVARRGRPGSTEDYAHHDFVTGPPHHSTTAGWLAALAPAATAVFTCADSHVTTEALGTGLGIGFLPEVIAQREPDLVQVHAPIPAWNVEMWLVTHVDLNWTAKVQAIARHLIEGANRDLAG